MTNVLRAVAGVLMVGLMSPSRAYADPVTITSGVLSHIILGPFSGNLSGMDASERSFSFEGGAEIPGVVRSSRPSLATAPSSASGYSRLRQD